MQVLRQMFVLHLIAKAQLQWGQQLDRLDFDLSWHYRCIKWTPSGLFLMAVHTIRIRNQDLRPATLMTETISLLHNFLVT